MPAPRNHGLNQIMIGFPSINVKDGQLVFNATFFLLYYFVIEEKVQVSESPASTRHYM